MNSIEAGQSLSYPQGGGRHDVVSALYATAIPYSRRATNTDM